MFKIFKRRLQVPSPPATPRVNSGAYVLAANGTVLIVANDGSTVAVTPLLARQLSVELLRMSHLAESRPIAVPDWPV